MEVRQLQLHSKVFWFYIISKSINSYLTNGVARVSLVGTGPLKIWLCPTNEIGKTICSNRTVKYSIKAVSWPSCGLQLSKSGYTTVKLTISLTVKDR